MYPLPRIYFQIEHLNTSFHFKPYKDLGCVDSDNFFIITKYFGSLLLLQQITNWEDETYNSLWAYCYIDEASEVLLKNILSAWGLQGPIKFQTFSIFTGLTILSYNLSQQSNHYVILVAQKNVHNMKNNRMISLLYPWKLLFFDKLVMFCPKPQ